MIYTSLYEWERFDLWILDGLDRFYYVELKVELANKEVRYMYM